MSYKVTVCIPVFNAELYLEDCINSLVSQTLNEIELIFVNDGSTDKSLEILENYAAKYSNIVILDQPNKGLGGARNTALKKATGEFIGFVDADDFVDIQMYEKLYSAAIQKDAEISFCSLRFFPKKLARKQVWFNEYKGLVTGYFLNKNTQPTNKIVSRNLINRIGFNFYDKNGDGQFIILMLNAKNIVSINEELYVYRVGHQSMSSALDLEKFEISVQSCEEQIRLLEQTRYKETLREYFEFRMIYVLLQVILVSCCNDERQHYNKYTARLKSMNYKTNPYTKKILKNEFGMMRYLGMTKLLPFNYWLSMKVSKIMRRMKQV